MKGDHIIVEEKPRLLGEEIATQLLPAMTAVAGRYAITVAGESGSGKSTIAVALAQALTPRGKICVILQQDDYYVLPPKTNDAARRKDVHWAGTREVRLDLLDQHIQDFLAGATEIVKPLSVYAEDRFDTETIPTAEADVLIVEGTYVTLLPHAQTRIFLARNYLDTREFRQKRARDAAELDEFTENILKIEHEIVTSHQARADVVVTNDYRIIVQHPQA